MGYSLKVLPKHLILKRNGKKAEVFYKKFKDDRMYEWLRRQIARSHKTTIDDMLSLVGIRQEQKARKRHDAGAVPSKAGAVT
jgi:hypothetical protein